MSDELALLDTYPEWDNWTHVRKGDHYYIVSYSHMANETMVFPADENGEVTNWWDVLSSPGLRKWEVIEWLRNADDL